MTASNTFGSTVSNVISFTTLGTEPTVTDLNVTDITGNEASMSVSVNPGRLSTASVLEYSTDNTFVTNVNTVPLNSTRGSDTQVLTTSLSNLRARTTYYTRVTSTNQLGSTASRTESFATIGDLPRATLLSLESALTSVSATVSVETGLLSGTVYLEASTNRSFENSSSSNVATFYSGGPTRHSLTVSGLTNRTDYFIRAKATNELGSFTTAIQTMRTAGGIPVIGSVTITPSTSTASLSASIDTTGLDTFVTADVSTKADFSDSTEYFLYSGTTSGEHRTTLKNLVPRVTYYLRVIATNDSGTVLSATKTFLAVTPVGVAINDDEETAQSPSVELAFTTPARTVAIRVSNYADFSHARVIPTTTDLAWQLLEPKGSRSTRTIWVQFISSEGTTTQYSDSIDVILDELIPSPTTTTVPTVTTSTTPTASTIPGVSVARALTTSQPVVVSQSYAPVRSATVVPRQYQANIKKIQTKIGKKISTRTVVASKSGKYVIVFPKGIKTMSVRFVNKSGVASAWSVIAAPK
jgi:hypothetical protein